MTERITGLAQIATRFEAMLIDQFGVIHDGRTLYAGAAQVMAELHRIGIPVVITTNSGKRAQASIDRTVRIGIPRGHFAHCVSSGEIAYQSLPGRRAFIIGKRGESYGYDGVEMVTDAAQAEVILIVGSNAPETSLDDYRHMLRGQKIPAICCNPDKLMITAHGLQPSSGAIATIYSELGGDVTWIGKPYRAIYDHALELLGHPKSVLCIGDSAEHDVAGGRGAGLSTLLVQQGVSAGVADEKIHPMPDYIMRAFTW